MEKNDKYLDNLEAVKKMVRALLPKNRAENYINFNVMAEDVNIYAMYNRWKKEIKKKYGYFPEEFYIKQELYNDYQKCKEGNPDFEFIQPEEYISVNSDLYSTSIPDKEKEFNTIPEGIPLEVIYEIKNERNQLISQLNVLLGIEHNVLRKYSYETLITIMAVYCHLNFSKSLNLIKNFIGSYNEYNVLLYNCDNNGGIPENEEDLISKVNSGEFLSVEYLRR